MEFMSGFYSEFAEMTKDGAPVSFGFLDNLRVTSESSAYRFLHGGCDEFAAILSKVFGYEIECVRNADGRLIHAYCTSHIGDQKAYIDVRGITIDPERFFSEFGKELFYYSPTGSILVEDDDGRELDAPREVWAGKDALFDGEYEGWDDPEIEGFIRDYVDYYDCSKFVSLWRCKFCGAEIEESDDDNGYWFDYCGEEDLWGHIQLEHPEIYDECQTWETPDMLEVYYDHIIIKRSACLEQLISHAKKDVLPAGIGADGRERGVSDSPSKVDARCNSGFNGDPR